MPSHALVLTAGLGTRLQPLTFVRAKPAVPVAGDPLIRRIIARLAGQGVTELVLNLHHLPATLTAVVGDGSDLGAHVRYSWEQPAVLGSAGGPRRALPLLGPDPFFIVNGDTMTDLDLRAFAVAHGVDGALVTLALVPNHEPDKYGGVLLGDDGSVTAFVRRGTPARGSYHFLGVQLAQADAFASVRDGEVANSIGEVYTRLLQARPGSIRGYVCDASFQDIGTPADYWTTWFTQLGDRAPEEAFGRGVQLGAGARVTRSILWNDVVVGEGAEVRDCIITDGVRIAPGSSYQQSIVRTEGGRLLVTPL
jgi:NDP-sugar pyrophosphorylase family protein